MLSITGINATLDILNIPSQQVLTKALRLTGEKILELSEPKLPVKEGILKSSQTVIQESDDVLVGYNSEYASYQHEGRRMDGTHIIRNRPAGGESFFLSSTVVENQNEIVQFTAEKIQNQIKSSQ